MDRTRTPHAIHLALLGLPVTLALAACTGSAAATASPSDAMMAHSPSPSESTMEPSPSPSDAMTSPAAPVAMGIIHAVDGTASGTAALFHKADGTFVITFEAFSIPSATGVHVVLVPNKDVASDAEIDKTTIVDLGALTGTSGMLDFTVPASADAMTGHAVVLWDTAMNHAIAAAPLR